MASAGNRHLILWMAAAFLWPSLGRAALDPASPLFDASRRVQGNLPSGDATTRGLVQGPVGWSLEGAVDPEIYRLLPGDQLHLGLWGETPRSYPLVVTPEGELIVPEIGPVRVAGLTLRFAEQRLLELMRPLYPKATLTLRLIAPGKFRIAVTGMVDRPGIFEATRTDRLTSALSQAGGVRGGGSLRRIRILRENDSTADSTGATEVDLMPWLVRGEKDSNPTLEPGMSVDVPAIGPTIRVRGPVNGRSGGEQLGATTARLQDRPEEEPNRILEWRGNDSVGSVLNLVGGLSERASGGAILFRDGELPRELNLSDAADRALPTKPGDTIEIGYASRWVFVVGAVRVPGRYPYLPGLGPPDYINMAGGPTELGRTSWWLESEGEKRVPKETPIAPGLTIRVPERRTFTVTTILTPLTSATAFLISVVALARR